MAGIPLPKTCLQMENVFIFMIIPFQSIIEYKYSIKYIMLKTLTINEAYLL